MELSKGEEDIIAQVRRQAQEEYCERKNVSFFAPKDYCYACRKNIWKKITIEEASTELITGCPYCAYSYCD